MHRLSRPRVASVSLRRACAVLAVCSVVLHGFAVTDARSVTAAVLTAGMGMACLYCARDLWFGDATRTWVLVAVMNLGMVALHLPSVGHHHGVAAEASGVTHHSSAMAAATVLSVVEAAVATVVLYRHSRRNGAVVAAGDSV